MIKKHSTSSVVLLHGWSAGGPFSLMNFCHQFLPSIFAIRACNVSCVNPLMPFSGLRRKQEVSNFSTSHVTMLLYQFTSRQLRSLTLCQGIKSSRMNRIPGSITAWFRHLVPSPFVTCSSPDKYCASAVYPFLSIKRTISPLNKRLTSDTDCFRAKG